MNYHRNWSEVVKVASILFFLMIDVSPGQIPADRIDKADEGVCSVQYTAEFSQDNLSFGKSGGYDIVYMRSAGVLSDLGKPVLPEVHLMMAVPPGTEVVSVEAMSLSSLEIDGDFYLMPGQPPLKTSERSSLLPVKPDDTVYNSRVSYPEMLAGFVHQSDLAGQEIAEITVFPVQYLPADRKLILHTSLELTVKCRLGMDRQKESGEYGRRLTEKQHRLYEKMLRTMVVNPEDVVLNRPSREMLHGLPSSNYDHVIITSSSYEPYFQPLVDWHTKKGLRDTVVTTDWIYGYYPGPGDTLKVRQFIIDSDTSWGTIYFLIGGEKNVVPFKYKNFSDEETPSDQYYSDYDDDWIHEVFVGRVSVQNSAEVTTFVNKVLKYEKDPPLTDYPLDILLIGMDGDDWTSWEDLKDLIDSYIPGRFNVNKVYDSHGGNHEDSAKSYLNAGQNLVNHADHSNYWVIGVGDYRHGWGIDRGEVGLLSNDNEMSILVSMGCWPNAMDYSDCIAEHFVIRNDYQAGVAFTGNTRSGFYYVGLPFSLSGGLDRNWWQAVFLNDQENLGEAIIDSKHRFSHSNPDQKHCEWTFNLLGEPAMPIWTDTPGSLVVTHDTVLPLGPSSFMIHVEDVAGEDVSEAYVCLWRRDEVYERDYTGGSGDAILNPSPLTTGVMYVTVTKKNYLPYEDSARVVNNPPAVPTNPSPSDSATDVSTNALLSWEGGDPNPDDTLTYDVYFGTDTVPPLVTQGLTETEYDPGIMESSTSYHWQIVAWDNHGDSTSSPIWNFATLAFACGDCNGDGSVTFADALYIKNYYYQTPPGSPPPIGQGDVNLDGSLTFGDALYVKNYYYQTPPGSPPPCQPATILKERKLSW